MRSPATLITKALTYTAVEKTTNALLVVEDVLLAPLQFEFELGYMARASLYDVEKGIRNAQAHLDDPATPFKADNLTSAVAGNVWMIKQDLSDKFNCGVKAVGREETLGRKVAAGAIVGVALGVTAAMHTGELAKNVKRHMRAGK